MQISNPFVQVVTLEFNFTFVLVILQIVDHS